MHDYLKHLDTTCPYCGSGAIKAFEAQAHDAPEGMESTVSIIECTSCIAAWQWPRHRSADESRQIFNNAYDEKPTGTYFDKDRRVAVSEYQADYLNNTLNIQPGRLLDIGCGDGVFAKAMASHGWIVTGVDPALPDACDLQQLEHIQLRRELNEPVNENNLFDVVTLMDVIEHVDDPVGFLQYAISFVRPGGYLVIETGNYQSTARIVNADNWWNYQLDHRWYFAPPQLRNLLSMLGMNNIDMANKTLRPWIKPQNGKNPSGLSILASALKSAFKNPLHPFSALDNHFCKYRAAHKWLQWHYIEIFTLIARKPEKLL